MKKSLYITLLLAVAVSFSSCSFSIHRSTDSLSLRPKEIRLELTMDDYELLGDIEVSVDYRVYYLPYIVCIDKVNGKRYDYRYKQKLSISKLSGWAYKGVLSKAQYKIIEMYPDADYVVPVYTTVVRENMLLGANVNKIAKFKVYKFRH